MSFDWASLAAQGGSDIVHGVLGGIGLYQNQIAQQNLDKVNMLNYNNQVANLDWQKAMYQNQMAREDNATQRRAEDLKAAGLSPVLAAGSPASSAAAPMTSAPEKGNNQEGRLAYAAMLNEIGKSAGEKYLLFKQAQIAEEQRKGIIQDNRSKTVQANIDEETGLLQARENLRKTINDQKAAAAHAENALQQAKLAEQNRIAKEMENELRKAQQGRSQSEITDSEKFAQQFGKPGSFAYKIAKIAHLTGKGIDWVWDKIKGFIK